MMRRGFKLGVCKTTAWDLLWLGPLTRTETDVQDAAARLGNPALRLRERLFWFHDGEELVQGISLASLSSAAATQCSASYPAARHDAAVIDLLAVFLLDPELKNERQWIDTLAEWIQVGESDEYWLALIDAETDGAFEPSASVEEIEELRKESLGLVADIIGSLARGAVARNDPATCQRALRILRAAHLPQELLSHLEEQIFGPLEEGFQALCDEVRRECSDKIKKDKESALANHVVCEAAVTRFEREVEPQLRRLLTLAGVQSDVARRAREVGANCLHGLAIDYTWADKFHRAEALLLKAYELATSGEIKSSERPREPHWIKAERLAGGSVAATRIQESLENVAPGARQERLWKNLKPVEHAPSLFTWNGLGLRIYGKSEEDPDLGSYMTTYYFVVFFLPLIPICRYRVIDAGGDS